MNEYTSEEMYVGKREEGVLKQTRTGAMDGCRSRVEVLYGSALAHPLEVLLSTEMGILSH